jgi:hypothetical protein
MKPKFSSTWLYEYITEPFKTIENYQNYTPVIEGLTLLTLLGIHSGIYANKSLGFGIGIAIFGIIFTWISSALSGLMAKLFDLTPQIATTFYWYAVASLPGIIAIPLDLIRPGKILLFCVSVLTGILGFILQYKSIKTIYKVPTGKALLITLAPLILTLCIVLGGGLLLLGSVALKALT